MSMSLSSADNKEKAQWNHIRSDSPRVANVGQWTETVAASKLWEYKQVSTTSMEYSREE